MPRITFEGKIGIALGLLGLLGAGAIMVAPQHLLIGWGLIGLALVGLVLLFCIHIASVVAPPKPSFRGRAAAMNPADTVFTIAAIAAAGAALTAVARYRGAAAVLALIACAAVAFDFVDRRWIAPQAPTETPISAENASMDPFEWAKGVPTPDIQRYFANVKVINSGKSTAVGLQHLGVVAHSEGPLDASYVTSIFLALKIQLKAVPYIVSSEIRPGNSNLFYTILGPATRDDMTKKLSEGTANLFVFDLRRYKDDKIGKDQFIYTENCVYYQKEVLHLCETGPNRTYISN